MVENSDRLRVAVCVATADSASARTGGAHRRVIPRLFAE